MELRKRTMERLLLNDLAADLRGLGFRVRIAEDKITVGLNARSVTTTEVLAAVPELPASMTRPTAGQRGHSEVEITAC